MVVSGDAHLRQRAPIDIAWRVRPIVFSEPPHAKLAEAASSHGVRTEPWTTVRLGREACEAGCCPKPAPHFGATSVRSRVRAYGAHWTLTPFVVLNVAGITQNAAESRYQSW